MRKPAKSRSIGELLAEPFPEGATFHLYQGIPYLVVADWDHAERWNTDPPTPAHPFAAVLSGERISEGEFRSVVLELRRRRINRALRWIGLAFGALAAIVIALLRTA